MSITALFSQKDIFTGGGFPFKRWKKHIIYYPFNFQASHKSQYCPGPSVTGPRRKRSQYWPWMCALGNTNMAFQLGRRLMEKRDQCLPGRYCNISQGNIGLSFPLACNLTGRLYNKVSANGYNFDFWAMPRNQYGAKHVGPTLISWHR